MELEDCVTFWAQETFSDMYGIDPDIVGKIKPFAEMTNSGPSSERRILETPPDQAMPASLALIAPTSAEHYIVGVENPDYWNNAIIRLKYPVLPGRADTSVGLDIGAILGASAVDPSALCYEYFTRRELDEDSRSDYLSGFELYFPAVKSYPRGSVVKVPGATDKFYRLKTATWLDGAGFSVGQAVQLESPEQVYDIESTSTVYDPVSDSYPQAIIPGVACFVEPLEQNYEFVTPSFSKIKVGDMAISVLTSDAALKVGDRVGGIYRVISVRDSGTWRTAQCRAKS